MFKFLAALACAISAHVCEAAPAQIQLTTANTVTLRGPVTATSTTEVMSQLNDYVHIRGKQTYPIYLVLDSPGGSIMAGDMLVQYLRTLQNVHTITIYGASMAAGIAQANPGIRYITTSGLLMFHRATGSFEGQFATGELESQLKLWTAYVEQMEQANADRMQISLQDYKARIINEWWLLGQDAVQSKAADFLVQVRCSSALIEEQEEIVIQGFLFSATKTFSRCPLFRAPLNIDKNEEEVEE